MVVGVVSYKGGVGTSTVSLGLAAGLARLGKRVLLVDMKPCGDLDIMTGLQDSALFGLDDLISGSEISDCVINCGGFDLCISTHSRKCDLTNVCNMLAAQSGYDFIIADSPYDLTSCDAVISVCNCDASSVRSAEEIAEEYFGKIRDLRLVINRFGEFDNAISPDEIIDITHTRLLGIVPFVPFMRPGERHTESENAFVNMSKRLLSQNVPVFENSKKRSVLKKQLFSKR